MSGYILHNAQVLTMDPARPRAQAVAVRDGRILAVGSVSEARKALDAGAEQIDCAGAYLLPAFIDAHCHLLAYAATLRSVDCTGARSVADIQRRIRARAAVTPEGQWLRAYGYEETALAEGRHPNAAELDIAASRHPVRLIHRSGHASVLNTSALRAAGIRVATEEPPGGVIDRDLATGEPSGLLLGMERFIEQATPKLSFEELSAAVREASELLLRSGISMVQDATHTNGRPEWELFERLIDEGSLLVDVVVMEGIDHLGELPEVGGAQRLRRGAVKIMLQELGDEVTPGQDELGRMVREVHDAGRQLAIHAVGERAVAAAANAIEEALRRRPRADHRHRIEHCSQLPAGLAPRLAAAGVFVVSQPSFVRERGERYLQLVPVEQQPNLYAFRTLADAGVSLAAGSDAPVTAPAPLASAAAASDRKTVSGRLVAPDQAVDVEEALRWWTAGSASATFLEGDRGSVRVGLLADLVMLTPQSAGNLPDASVQRLWRAGSEVVLNKPRRT